RAWGRKPLSQTLQGQRENLKISLQEAARLTDISVKYLYLLKRTGEEQFLTAPLSLIPSLRCYAAFLNLNPDIAVAQFVAELEKLPPSKDTGSGARQTQLLTLTPQPQVRVLPRIILPLLALGLLAYVGYYSALTQEQRPNEDKYVSRPLASA